MRALELLDSLNSLDEHERIDAKRASEIGKSVLETVCAFANEPGLGGGWLLLGVARSDTALVPAYEVEGLTQLDKVAADLATQCRAVFNRPVRIDVTTEKIQDKAVIAVTVPEAPRPPGRGSGETDSAWLVSRLPRLWTQVAYLSSEFPSLLSRESPLLPRESPLLPRESGNLSPASGDPSNAQAAARQEPADFYWRASRETWRPVWALWAAVAPRTQYAASCSTSCACATGAWGNWRHSCSATPSTSGRGTCSLCMRMASSR